MNIKIEPELFCVPPLVGRKIDDGATKDLVKRFTVRVHPHYNSDQAIASGTILRQDPSAGECFENPPVIKVDVADGPPPADDQPLEERLTAFESDINQKLDALSKQLSDIAKNQADSSGSKSRGTSQAG